MISSRSLSRKDKCLQRTKSVSGYYLVLMNDAALNGLIAEITLCGLDEN